VGSLETAVAWIAENPGAFAWICFGILSAAVMAYRANEERIRAMAARTETKADDRFVALLDGLVAVFEVLRLLAPHGLARPRPPRDDDA